MDLDCIDGRIIGASIGKADFQGELFATLARKSPCARASSGCSSQSCLVLSINLLSINLIQMTTQIIAPVEGYPKLACHIGKYAQSAIYRRFGSLNSQNILYMQAELAHLEKSLRKVEAEDSAIPEGNRSKYSKDWYWLKNYAAVEHSKQWETVLTIRQKLKDYSLFQTTIMRPSWTFIA